MASFPLTLALSPQAGRGDGSLWPRAIPSRFRGNDTVDLFKDSLNQSAVILPSLMTLAHLSDSLLIMFASSSRVPGIGVSPCLSSCSRTSGELSTLTSSLFQRSRRAGGVLPGATKAYQLVASNPGKPDSAIVGTSSMDGVRVKPVVASARSLPEAMCGPAVEGVE